MSDIPSEDIALAAKHLSDDEIVLTIFRTVKSLGAEFTPELKERFKNIEQKLENRIPLRRKLEKNPELARELIADYPIYASTSGLHYEEMIDICVALNLDEEVEDE